MASASVHEKVNILLVDDQESRLTTYEAILEASVKPWCARIRGSRRCSV